MKNLGIAYNCEIKNAVDVKEQLVDILKNKGFFAESFEINDLKSKTENSDDFDFIFVIGGDGTLLKAARFYTDFKAPVFGINLGRLGFLAQSHSKNLEETVDLVLEGKYLVENRMMLESENMLALNDFVIKGTSNARTSRFYLNINDKFVCDYVADGLIVSTPTGSTAYGLSAGGPVLEPSIDALIIVPICPHTLNARPIVIPSSEEIEIYSCDTCEMCITPDGIDSVIKDGTIKIRKSSKVAKLARLENNNFYSIIRNKLHWGVSPINSK